jgi:hypothetical protein
MLFFDPEAVSPLWVRQRHRAVTAAAELASIADADETWRPSTVRPRPCWRQVLPGNRPPRLTGVAPAAGHKPPPALQKKIGR